MFVIAWLLRQTVPEKLLTLDEVPDHAMIGPNEKSTCDCPDEDRDRDAAAGFYGMFKNPISGYFLPSKEGEIGFRLDSYADWQSKNSIDPIVRWNSLCIVPNDVAESLRMTLWRFYGR